MSSIKVVPVHNDVPQIPAGYRLLTISEAKEHRAAIAQHLGGKETLYVEKGKIEASADGDKIVDIDGPLGIFKALVIKVFFTKVMLHVTCFGCLLRAPICMFRHLVPNMLSSEAPVPS
jgi:hypothetical protein